MANGACHREGRDRHRRAPAKLPTVLDLEMPTPHRTTDRPRRHLYADSHDGSPEPAQRAADSRRIAEAWDRRLSGDRREIWAASASLASGAEPARATAGADASGAPPVPTPEKTRGVVSRPAVEVADILHAQGDAFVEQHPWLSLQQRSVLYAIARCRTADIRPSPIPMSESSLPQVPGAGPGALAPRPRARPTRRPLCPRRLHAATWAAPLSSRTRAALLAWPPREPCSPFQHHRHPLPT